MAMIKSGKLLLRLRLRVLPRPAIGRVWWSSAPAPTDDKPMAASIPEPLLPVPPPLLLRPTAAASNKSASGLLKRRKIRNLPKPTPDDSDLPNLFCLPAYDPLSLADRLLAEGKGEEEGAGHGLNKLPALMRTLQASESLDPLLVVEGEDLLGMVGEVRRQLAGVSRLFLSREDCQLIHALLAAHRHGLALPTEVWDPLPGNRLANRTLRAELSEQLEAEEAEEDFAHLEGMAPAIEDEQSGWVYSALEEQLRAMAGGEHSEWTSLQGLIRHHQLHDEQPELSVYGYALRQSQCRVLVLEGMPHNREELISSLRQAGAVAICLRVVRGMEGGSVGRDERSIADSPPTLHPTCNHLHLRLTLSTEAPDGRLRFIRNYRLVRDLLVQLDPLWRQLPHLPVNLAIPTPAYERLQDELPAWLGETEPSWSLEQAAGLASLIHGSFPGERKAEEEEEARLSHLGHCLRACSPPPTTSHSMAPNARLPLPASMPNRVGGKQLPDPESLTKHERRFLSQIVTPGISWPAHSSLPNIDMVEVKFADIGALETAKRTLHELISLPLEQPHWFHRGILSHATSGVLLFGPPGTGKTMLAKAVAAQSGACFLAVNSASIYDMYVGEGEKNARALFSLARRLSPCVLFIDEVDALLDSRDNGVGRASRIEVMNELMSEWDGLLSAKQARVMVMAATNRPFALDDAVLRRLPRRLHIDLPDAAARTTILRLLLKEDQLAEDVDLAAFATQLEWYSGSDLKNLCIAAAYRALRSLPDQTIRDASLIITSGHLEGAREDVPASLSDRMETVQQLRRWDQIYGEGKRRREEAAVFGFL